MTKISGLLASDDLLSNGVPKISNFYKLHVCTNFFSIIFSSFLWKTCLKKFFRAFLFLLIYSFFYKHQSP